MKILNIGNYNSPLATYEAQIKQFIIMHQMGYDVTIQGHFSEEIENLLTENAIPLIHDKAKNKQDSEFCNRLSKYVTEFKIDIVHVFGGTNTANACIALKNINVIVIGYMGSTSIHWHDPSAYKTYLHSRIDAIICNSEDNSHHFRKQLWGKQKQKVFSIYKGYGLDWFKNIEPANLIHYGIPKDAIVVCSVGNRRKVKAMDLFIKATNYIEPNNNLHFIIVGEHTDDEYMNRLKNKSKHQNNIHLLGFKSNIKEIIKRCNIYVQTSKKEGLGRAITESMCLKKPVIVTNAGGCTELVDDGVSGYIAHNKDPKSIAEKINLLINNQSKIDRFGQAGYHRIETIFNIQNTVNQTLDLYKTLITKQ